jgi:hypothetical protein
MTTHPNTTRATMTNTTTNTTSSRTIGHPIFTLTRVLMLGLAGCIFIAGCGPTFDPASLIKNTRVIGARIEVDGAPDRATPMPGETANVTWLVTSQDATPPLGWAFAVCVPGTVNGKTSLGCQDAPLARFDGTGSPPRLSIPVPAGTALGGAASIVLYGQICAGPDSTPTFDPQSGLPGCTDGRGTTVSLDVPLQLGDDANHNPTADRAFTLDGEAWSTGAASDDPCAVGPRVAAGSNGHVIGNTTAGSDREPYTVIGGSPAAATPTRERLQISQFTTAGELKSQFSFVEATDESAASTVDVTWDAPEAAEVPAGGMGVTFTFVIRDDRGGTDWTTRTLCVTQ